MNLYDSLFFIADEGIENRFRRSMPENEFQHTDITRKIIGCAMKVHSYFGMGFPEIVYKKALSIELEKVGLRYESEVERNIYYQEILIGKRRLDLLVEGKVLVELKAVLEVDKAYHNQILNYLKIFGLEVGLLLNFGAERLHFRRFASGKQH